MCQGGGNGHQWGRGKPFRWSPASGTARNMHPLVQPWQSQPELTESCLCKNLIFCSSWVGFALISVWNSPLKHHLPPFLRCFYINVCIHICNSVWVCTRTHSGVLLSVHVNMKVRDHFHNLVLSLHHVGPRDQTQAIWLGSEYLYQWAVSQAWFLRFGALRVYAQGWRLAGFIWALNWWWIIFLNIIIQLTSKAKWLRELTINV